MLDSLVAEILEVEERYNLNKINISGIPAWPILKYRLRGHYLISKGVTDITLAKNNKTKRSIRSVKYWFISLFQLLSLLFSKKNVKYCFVGFTRLENVNNKRIDKFFTLRDENNSQRNCILITRFHILPIGLMSILLFIPTLLELLACFAAL